MSWEQSSAYKKGMTLEFGKLPSKQRVRRGLNGAWYVPDATSHAEKRIRAEWVRRYGLHDAEWRGGVNLHVVYKREVAKSAPKKDTGRLQLKKPDGDNVLKLVADALNGVAWADDEQVIEWSISRVPQGEPGSGAWVSVSVEYINERRAITPRYRREDEDHESDGTPAAVRRRCDE